MRQDFDNPFVVPVEIDGMDGVIVEIRIPEATVVPPRPFTESQALAQNPCGHIGIFRSPVAPRFAVSTTVRSRSASAGRIASNVTASASDESHESMNDCFP